MKIQRGPHSCIQCSILCLLLSLVFTTSHAQQMQMMSDGTSFPLMLPDGEFAILTADEQTAALVIAKIDRLPVSPEGAQNVDVRARDYVLTLNGTKTPTIRLFQQIYLALPAGAEVTLGIRRGNEPITLTFNKPHERDFLPKEAPAGMRIAPPRPAESRNDVTENTSSWVSKETPTASNNALYAWNGHLLEFADGALHVVMKQRHSLGATLDLQPDDTILSFNGTPVTSLDMFITAYEDLKTNAEVRLIVQRKNVQHTVTFQKP